MAAPLDPLVHRSHQRASSQGLALREGTVEAVNGCVLCLDADGIMSFVDRSAAQLLGLPGAQLVGRSFMTLHAVRSRPQLAQALRAVVSEQLVYQLDTRHELAPGARTIRWTLAALHDGVLATGVDITWRLELEQQNAENDAMAVMDTLATGLAHEIRNPLNAANLQLELLLSRAQRAGDAQLAARLRDPAGLVRVALGRLSAMLDEFLQAARPSEPVRSLCSVGELFASVLASQLPLTERAGIELHSYAEDGLQARCDGAKIKQVLTNLVRNGVDALADRGGGQVLLHAERRADGGVTIAVLDDGHGLDQSMQHDAAFAPFSTTKPAGSGLGLAIARKIVSQHGGTIQLVARPGLGTAASFWISA